LKKVKQIAAIVGIVLLVGLYVLTLISAILSTPQAASLFQACIYCTITVPCLIWGFEIIYRILKGDDQDES